MTYPHDDDAVAYLFATIIGQYGWEWFDGLLKQNVQWVRGTGDPAGYIAERNATRTLSFTTTAEGQLAGKIPDDSHVYWPQTGAIFASTTRPESSKLFMNWLLSDEYQANFNGSYLARKDLTSSAGVIWEDPSTALTDFNTWMENRENVEWWRLQFETSIGTAQGKSPMLSKYGSR